MRNIQAPYLVLALRIFLSTVTKLSAMGKAERVHYSIVYCRETPTTERKIDGIVKQDILSLSRR